MRVPKRIILPPSGQKARSESPRGDMRAVLNRPTEGISILANLETEQLFSVLGARRRARNPGYLQRAQIMVIAAGLAACGIVAVAAAMMSTLL